MTRWQAKLLAITSYLSAIGVVDAAAPPDTVGFKFEKQRMNIHDLPYLTKRQSDTVTATLANELTLYFINVTVGTPGQPFSLQIDTGSSDIWFPAAQANICQQRYGCPYGTYDADASSTYRNPGDPEFSIEYVDGTQIQGQYISDVFNIGSTSLTNLTMAAATEANARGVGIMGIGFAADESAAARGGFQYPSVIDVLQSEGFIKTRAYSLWLDDLNSNTGSILFGGVDSSKYQGELVALPIQIDTQTNSISSFTIAWTGLTVHGSGQSVDFSPSTPQAAILDSGTTDLLLPDDIANDIFNGVGVITDPQFGNLVHCSLAADDLTFSFTFGGSSGPIINVSLSEFVVPIATTDGSQATFEDGSAACLFGIEAAGNAPILFGDTFLRSAYVVYDLDNQQIGLAQTNFNSNNAKIQAFSSSGGIPGVSSTATGASVAQTLTGIPKGSAVGTATAGSNFGSGNGGTSRSATFHLSATAASTGGSSSSSSSAANASFKPQHTAQYSIVIAGVLLLGVLFGGGMMIV